MISMSACGWGGKPAPGAMVSSFHTRNAPQCTRLGSWYSAKEKWCLASSQPWLAAPRVARGRRSIMVFFGGFVDGGGVSVGVGDHEENIKYGIPSFPFST